MDNLFLITVKPPSDDIHQFVAEKCRAWDRSEKICLHAGNAQGGPGGDFGFKDSVIKAFYYDYHVTGLYATKFDYPQFDENHAVLILYLITICIFAYC